MFGLFRFMQKSAVSYLAKQAGENNIVESVHQQWLNCIFKELPFQHLVNQLVNQSEWCKLFIRFA